MFHCLAWAALQLQYSPTACGTSQIQFNPTQVREEMGHPVALPQNEVKLKIPKWAVTSVTSVKGIPYMTSAKCSDFFTPPPLSEFYVLFVRKFEIFFDPPLCADVIYGSPLTVTPLQHNPVGCKYFEPIPTSPSS